MSEVTDSLTALSETTDSLLVMSETTDACQPGFRYLLQLHAEAQERTAEALRHAATSTGCSGGMAGVPMPYRLQSEGMVSAVLFACFVMASIALARGKRHLGQQFKAFFMGKEYASQGVDTAGDMRHMLMLIFQTCMLLGFCVYDYYADRNVLLFTLVPHALLLAIYIFSIVAFQVCKWLAYRGINAIFFNKSSCLTWIRDYFTVQIFVGFALFPLVLLLIYFDLSPQISPLLVMIVVVFAKILLIYKCFCIFFHTFHGSFHLILYFCALEVIPSLMLWRGIDLANDLLILKF